GDGSRLAVLYLDAAALALCHRLDFAALGHRRRHGAGDFQHDDVVHGDFVCAAGVYTTVAGEFSATEWGAAAAATGAVADRESVSLGGGAIILPSPRYSGERGRG